MREGSVESGVKVKVFCLWLEKIMGVGAQIKFAGTF